MRYRKLRLPFAFSGINESDDAVHQHVDPSCKTSESERSQYCEASRCFWNRGMNDQARTGIRSLVGVALGLSTFFWFIAFRFISLPVLIVAWVLFCTRGRRDIRHSLAAWSVFMLLMFSPIDLLPFPRKWPPRIVPLVMGLPRRETLERARRGEVILGGCLTTGFEPKYYLVW